jgi:hypothetical protein
MHFTQSNFAGKTDPIRETIHLKKEGKGKNRRSNFDSTKSGKLKRK